MVSTLSKETNAMASNKHSKKHSLFDQIWNMAFSSWITFQKEHNRNWVYLEMWDQDGQVFINNTTCDC